MAEQEEVRRSCLGGGAHRDRLQRGGCSETIVYIVKWEGRMQRAESIFIKSSVQGRMVFLETCIISSKVPSQLEVQPDHQHHYWVAFSFFGWFSEGSGISCTLAKFKFSHNHIRVLEVNRRADHAFVGSRVNNALLNNATHECLWNLGLEIFI
ncbi:hypothetical protein CKAN_01391300 [Cinnamomum micranthum f. kanehirae]|uniref:Uncharacterized protein n=1 Tax=Cinnamomum micranthum f. kanehirae TaxID=337451 RepID=A0A3S3NRI4_9MAGN|nr:hypothetical protein CKAN_01391300 [Cinnamomum micranthum f. kanehirae]